MRVHDPMGEYSAEEIKAALHGIDNSRKLSFRYERLDKFNNKIEDIDYVTKCSIEQNMFADVKKTAKFDMVDTGSFDFLQDRIKPYVRIAMPDDGNYFDRMRALAPVIWYKLDDPARTSGTDSYFYSDQTSSYFYYDLSHARAMDLRLAGMDKLESEFRVSGSIAHFARVLNTTSDPIRFRLTSKLNLPDTRADITYRVWASADITGVGAIVVATGTLNLALNNYADVLIDAPVVNGYYFFEQFKAEDPSYKPVSRTELSIGHLAPLADSSENKATGYTPDVNFGSVALINNESSKTTVGDSGNFFGGNFPVAPAVSSPIGGVDGRRAVKLTASEYIGSDKIATRPGDVYYIEFIAKGTYEPQDPSSVPRPGLFVTTANDGDGGASWKSRIVQGVNTRKIRNLEAGWALFGETITIDPRFSGVVQAQILFSLPARQGSNDAFAPYFMDMDSVKFIRRVSVSAGGVGESGKSISPSPGKPQGWMTRPNMDIGLKESISINYWQKLGSKGAALSHKTVFSISEGSIVLSVDRSVNSNAVFKASVTKTGVYDPFSYAANLTVPARYFDDQTHMVTVTVEPDRDRVGVYIDGSHMGWMVANKATGFKPLSAARELFSMSKIKQVSVNFDSPTTTSLIDDFTIHSKALPNYALRDLSELGKNSKVQRRGWVEWPQGVFVLSAPSRTMRNGNEVVRGVEAYDQLLVLREDSYATRFSALSGTKYTDALELVLQSTMMTETVTEESKHIWNIWPGVTRPTPDTVVFTANTRTEYHNISTREDKVRIKNSVISGKVSSVVFELGMGLKSYGAYWLKTGTRLGIGISYGYQGTTSIHPVKYDNTPADLVYNPTTHAFLRVRESAGRFYYDYSADGTKWTNYWSYRHDYADSDTASMNLSVKMEAGTSTCVVTRFRFSGVANTERVVPNNSTVIPNTLEWEPGTPKLKIINDLLNAINYDSATYDENGKFVAKPYVSPTLRPSEYTFETNSESIITGDVDQTIDLFEVPNSWIIVVSNPETPPMVASYTNDNPNSITSTVARGRTIVDVRTENEAASQAVLNARVMRLATEASQIYEHIEMTTALFPVMGNSDVVTLKIDGLVINDKYSSTGWSMELSNGAVMKHKLRRTVAI